MGAILIALASLILLEDRWLAPWFPILFVSVTAACLIGVRELLSMLDASNRPASFLCYWGVVALIVANWRLPLAKAGIPLQIDTWHLIGLVYVFLGIACFLNEIYQFRAPGRITERIAQTLLVIFYLGILPSFFLQLRWLEPVDEKGFLSRSTLALALTVFIPKCADIGAFFTGKYLAGRILGKHLMTPLLSPKKTWQGLVGGLLAAVVTSIAISASGPALSGTAALIGFGLSVGLAGVFGDLAESLLKRDRQLKDASHALPGFGGVLDVIDSLLFAAPVAYLWLR